MPRVNLSPEEAELIERVRAKTAADRAFNEGLDAARAIFREWHSNGDANITTVEEAIQSARRSIRLVP